MVVFSGFPEAVTAPLKHVLKLQEGGASGALPAALTVGGHEPADFLKAMHKQMKEEGENLIFIFLLNEPVHRLYLFGFWESPETHLHVKNRQLLLSWESSASLEINSRHGGGRKLVKTASRSLHRRRIH